MKHRIPAMSLLMILLILVTMAGAASPQMSVRFFDVGQGDAAAVRFPNGEMLVIDAGPQATDLLLRKLRQFGADKQLRIMITHPHSDHLTGFPGILDAFTVKAAYDTGYPHPSPVYEGILHRLVQNKIPYTLARRGQTIRFGDARVEILHPDQTDRPPDPNEASIVCLVVYNQFRVLFTGDAGTWAEKMLLGRKSPLRAEVLKAGHHGSRHSTSQAFLAAVKPKVLVISAAKKNQYGHPHPETLARIKSTGAKVYTTADSGDITVITDGIKWRVETQR